MGFWEALKNWFTGQTTTTAPSKTYYAPTVPAAPVRAPVQQYPIPAPKPYNNYSRFDTPPAGKRFDPYFSAASMKYGIPYGLLSAIANKETGGTYNPSAKNRWSGASGLMQLMPLHHSAVNPFDPVASIYYAAAMLRDEYRRFGSWAKAIAAYNAGLVKVRNAVATSQSRGGQWQQYLPFETRDYLQKVAAPTGLANV